MGVVKCELGNTYGRLRVVDRAPRSGQFYRWLCKCSCGISVEVDGASLRNGHTRSCGCLQREAVTSRNSKHEMSGHPAYKVFISAKQRCTNPKQEKYPIYGGRGIEFRFKSFDQFWGELGYTWKSGLTLDRIKNEGNYEPGNCRWVSRAEQARNQRSNIWITYKGEALILRDWAERTGINYGTLKTRYRLFPNDFDYLFRKPKGLK